MVRIFAILTSLGALVLLTGCSTILPASEDSLETPAASGTRIFAPVLQAPDSGAAATETGDPYPAGSGTGSSAAADSSAPYPAGDGSGPMAGSMKGTVFVENLALVVSEEPAKVQLEVSGNLPTPCHFFGWEISPPDPEGIIRIEVFSSFDPDKICIQVIKPFEDTIELTDLPPGEYIVMVNEEEVGEFELDEAIGNP
jgi:hypothetical protein